MGSLEGSLPAYMNPGRGSMPGPRTGVYFTWVISGKNLATSETSTFRLRAPMDLRLEEITVNADDVTSDPTYRVKKGVSTAAGSDIIATGNWPADDTAETTSGSDLSNRDIDKDDYVTVILAADSGDTLLGYCITITGYAQGHMHDDPVYD